MTNQEKRHHLLNVSDRSLTVFLHRTLLSGLSQWEGSEFTNQQQNDDNLDNCVQTYSEVHGLDMHSLIQPYAFELTTNCLDWPPRVSPEETCAHKLSYHWPCECCPQSPNGQQDLPSKALFYCYTKLQYTVANLHFIIINIITVHNLASHIFICNIKHSMHIDLDHCSSNHKKKFRHSFGKFA